MPFPLIWISLSPKIPFLLLTVNWYFCLLWVCYSDKMIIVSDHITLHCDRRPTLPIERKWKSNVEVAPNCPRCASANTKFCYYNNYSLSQPRYFCKGCRRYWTRGGSLRNVPVGVGYRKTRRGRASRVEKSGQFSMNYSNNSTSFCSHQDNVIGVSSSYDGDSGNQPGPASGSDIDLALVFAKFLNHNACVDQPDDEIVTQISPNEDNNDSQNDSSMEYRKPVVHSIPEFYKLQEMPQVKQQLEEKNCSIHEMFETDHQIEAFGLQNLLADEMVLQDALWSDDGAAATNPNFEWQVPMVQLQQFESFPVDDQLNISANLMTEDCGSFDLSGFGPFSKP